MPKDPDRWTKVKQAHQALVALYPELFSLDKPRPFRVGFWRDVREHFPDMPKPIRNRLLSWLTVRRAYLTACVEGTPRYGFNGPDGVVTAREAAYAVEAFGQRNAKAIDPWPLEKAA